MDVTLRYDAYVDGYKISDIMTLSSFEYETLIKLGHISDTPIDPPEYSVPFTLDKTVDKKKQFMHMIAFLQLCKKYGKRLPTQAKLLWDKMFSERFASVES
jgi:hypothetical protein